MSLAYCKNCLERIEGCQCDNQEVIYGESRLLIASIIKMLKDAGEDKAVVLVEKML